MFFKIYVNGCSLQDTPVQGNHMNNMLTDMYRTNTSESRGPTTQNEFPIDISSDESEVEDSIPKSANNGMLTFLIAHQMLCLMNTMDL